MVAAAESIVSLTIQYFAQVISKSDLASAARRVWLAVHPDRNKAPGAQEASQSLSTILTSFKKKGAL